MRIAYALLLLVGCAYEARLPASHFAESATVVPAGHAEISGAVGGGASFYGGGGGASMRARVGVGGGQEVRVEATALDLSSTKHNCTIDCGPSDNTETVATSAQSALVSWKARIERLSNISVIAGIGASRYDHVDEGDPRRGRSIDGAFAMIANRRVRPGLDVYGGARLALAVPVGTGAMDVPAVIGAAGAIGLDAKVAEAWHFYAEADPRITVPSDDPLAGDLGVSLVLGLGVEL